MHAVDCLVADRGELIIEAPYFANLVAYTEYDTIYHEHLSYLSLRPLVPFFRRFDMEVFNIQQVEIHGGSFRVFVGRSGAHPVSPEVDRLLAQELETRLHAPETLQAFAHSVRQNRKDLLWLLHRLKNDGKSIAGESTRGGSRCSTGPTPRITIWSTSSTSRRPRTSDGAVVS